jgi:hypothetical protein
MLSKTGLWRQKTFSLKLAMTVVGFFVAGVMILQAFDDWDERPLLTTIESFDAPVNELVFPAVTVCTGQYQRCQIFCWASELNQPNNALVILPPPQKMETIGNCQARYLSVRKCIHLSACTSCKQLRNFTITILQL